MAMNNLLTDRFNVSEADLQQALGYQNKYGGRLEQILVNLGSLPDDQVPEYLSLAYDVPIFDAKDWSIERIEIPNDLLDSLFESQWAPIQKCEEKYTFICIHPLELKINEVLTSSAIDFELLVCNESDFQSVRQLYTQDEQEHVFDNISDEDERLKELASEAPTVNLLNSLISRALRAGASDMHLEPYDGKYRARFRIDGVLHEAETLAANMQLPIVTRLKILSGMDIAEKRRPQDGKIEIKIANQELDIRVSALPLNDGESVVMRFLKKENVQYDLDVLGLSTDVEEQIKRDIKTTAGVVLLTGPTGSGKTTTLYTFLNELNNDDVKIITLEDPVEYQLEGINQVQVNSEIGFDFSAGLRSIVRQDPDIIMLGEIRDKETAQIALQSALTGHLVFSTVHTNDAASAYTRLLDLGVEEFLLNAALVSVVAQRLARKVCQHCAEPDENQAELINQYELEGLAKRFDLDNIRLVKGKGCEHCGGSGYRGRLAITEYLGCDDHIKSLSKDADFIAKAKQHNLELNRRTLLEDGLFKALCGLTTVDEALRVAG